MAVASTAAVTRGSRPEAPAAVGLQEERATQAPVRRRERLRGARRHRLPRGAARAGAPGVRVRPGGGGDLARLVPDPPRGEAPAAGDDLRPQRSHLPPRLPQDRDGLQLGRLLVVIEGEHPA